MKEDWGFEGEFMLGPGVDWLGEVAGVGGRGLRGAGNFERLPSAGSTPRDGNVGGSFGSEGSDKPPPPELGIGGS